MRHIDDILRHSTKLAKSQFASKKVEEIQHMPRAAGCELKQLGYDLKRVQGRVAEIYGMDEKELSTPGRQKRRAEARSVVLYWGERELGLSGTMLAKRFGMSQPGVAYAVKRGERIAEEKGYRLL
jgi:chromosomal replication initiation ATPase DnaA